MIVHKNDSVLIVLDAMIQYTMYHKVQNFAGRNLTDWLYDGYHLANIEGKILTDS